MGQNYVIGMALINYNTGAIKDKEVIFPLLSFQEFPPMMAAEEGGPFEYFSISKISSKTNSEGIYYLRLRVEYGGVGAYVPSLDFGSCVSIPFSLITKNTITSIQIEAEPGFRSQEPDSLTDEGYYTGRMFEIKARVRIHVEKGPKSNYIIIAHPKAVTENSTFSVDILPQSQFDLDEKKENYLGWVTTIQGLRYAKTNSAGEATFMFLSVWDVSGENGT